jgi:hypothetical protein
MDDWTQDAIPNTVTHSWVDQDALTQGEHRANQEASQVQDTFLAQRQLLCRIMDQLEILFMKTRNHVRHYNPIEVEEVDLDFWELWVALGRLKMSLLSKTVRIAG